MIDLSGITGIPFLKKSRFTGSDQNMNYVLEKRGEEEVCLAAIIWQGPNCYDKTPEERKTTECFAFTEEGLLQAQDWMNAQSSRFNNQKK